MSYETPQKLDLHSETLVYPNHGIFVIFRIHNSIGFWALVSVFVHPRPLPPLLPLWGNYQQVLATLALALLASIYGNNT